MKVVCFQQVRASAELEEIHRPIGLTGLLRVKGYAVERGDCRLGHILG